MSDAQLTRIMEIANRLFPFEDAEPWDNCGIQIGNPSGKVSAAAFSLDPTPETVKFAALNGCQLLITHHPVFMDKVRRITTDDIVGRTVLLAAKEDVSIVSLHTNLDAGLGGLNDHVAEKLSLELISQPDNARCARIGDLKESMTVTQLARKVASDLDVGGIRIVTRQDRQVKRVFCATGSGMGYLHEAIRLGADVMVTGDVKYHAAREALEMGLPVIDAGHYGLEKHAPTLLANRFRKGFEAEGLDIACFEYQQDKDPFTEYVAWEENKH